MGYVPKPFSKFPVPDSAVTSNPADWFSQAGESLEGRTVMQFATYAAALSAVTNNLTVAERKGCVVWCDTPGAIYVHNGITLVRVGGELFTYSGVVAGTTQPTGLLACTFDYPFATGVLPRVTLTHKVTAVTDPTIVLRLYAPNGYLTNSTFHVQALKSDSTAPQIGFIEFCYTATGPRPDGST